MSVEAPAASQVLPPTEIAVDEQLLLRRADQSDPDRMFALIARNRAFLCRTLSWAEDITHGQVRDNYTLAIGGMVRGQAAPYDIYENETLVGAVNLHSRQGSRAQLGYFIGQEATGRGIATRAASEAANFGLDDWGLNSLFLFIKPNNVASQGVARRLNAQRLSNSVRQGEDGFFQMYTAWRLQK
jgi:RimJ/RimL family protein N-acetyltransferase